VDHFESDLCAVKNSHKKAQKIILCIFVAKNGFAPRGALLAALWGDEPAGKLRLYLPSEAVRTFTELLLEVE